MTLHRFVFCLTINFGLFATCADALSAQDFYSQNEVLDVKSFWESEVTEAREQSIKPSLNAEQLRIVNRIKWELPTDSDGNLIGFGALDSRVILPIRSWMFVQDLVVAYLWQDVNNCRPTVLTYCNLLKYRDPASLPGGRFPDPIKATGIPSPNTATLAQLSSEFATRFQRVF